MSNVLTVEVSTLAYQFSHRKLPHGRGLWLFFLGDSGELIWPPSNLTYTAARKHATEVARSSGVSRIAVAP
jgi:hypothetical protein